jgi:hypothetical protein
MYKKVQINNMLLLILTLGAELAFLRAACSLQTIVCCPWSRALSLHKLAHSGFKAYTTKEDKGSLNICLLYTLLALLFSLEYHMFSVLSSGFIRNC